MKNLIIITFVLMGIIGGALPSSAFSNVPIGTVIGTSVNPSTLGFIIMRSNAGAFGCRMANSTDFANGKYPLDFKVGNLWVCPEIVKTIPHLPAAYTQLKTPTTSNSIQSPLPVGGKIQEVTPKPVKVIPKKATPIPVKSDSSEIVNSQKTPAPPEPVVTVSPENKVKPATAITFMSIFGAVLALMLII